MAEQPASDAEFLRQFLAGRDVQCPQCDYNLRDLTGTRCPECGEELVLRLQLGEPRQAAALAGLIALNAGAGMNLLLIGYALMVMRFRGGFDRWFVPFLVVNAGGLVVLGACIALWLRYWRQIRRLNAWRRWALVAAAAALSLADLLVFTKYVT
jgi:hypothetical protein